MAAPQAETPMLSRTGSVLNGTTLVLIRLRSLTDLIHDWIYRPFVNCFQGEDWSQRFMSYHYAMFPGDRGNYRRS